MGSMRRVKLGDVALVEISGVDKKTNEGEVSVRLCNYTDVYKNWAITSSMHDSFMGASANEREIAKFSLHRGQVAVTKDSETRDDIGIPTYIADNFDDVILGYHCALITPDETQLNGKYLNAFLHTDFIHKFFSANASGSGQRYTLSIETLNSIPIYLPSLEEQERIGNIFSSIDRKIELNRQINDYLEAIARQLYDYWFVQFDFPDENGNPYKSSGLKRVVPKGWDSKFVGEVIKPLQRGISYSSNDISSDNGVPFLNLACFDKKGEYRIGEMKTYSGRYSEEEIVYPFDMFIACTDMTQGADIIGRPIMATKESDFFLFTMDLAKISPLSIQKYYLYYTLKTSFYHHYIKPFASGTNVKHLDIKGVTNYRIIVPTQEYQSRFKSIIHPIKQLQMDNLNELLVLTEYRDRALPLLMNGQVSVKQLNNHLSHD